MQRSMSALTGRTTKCSRPNGSPKGNHVSARGDSEACVAQSAARDAVGITTRPNIVKAKQIIQI